MQKSPIGENKVNTGRNRLKLNQRDARWLGVCAGVAEWLDVPAALVRIIYVICVITWPTLSIGYFLLYFCLDKDITPDKMRKYFKNAATAEHFKKLNYRKPIYKNERNKRVAGVCSGIADYFEVSAFAVRAVTLFSLFLFGPFTFWAYIVCMFIFEPDPYAAATSREERQAKRKKRKRHKTMHKEDYAEAPKYSVDEAYATLKELTRKHQNGELEVNDGGKNSEIYNSLELRLREIEAYMTSKKFRLHCEINRI